MELIIDKKREVIIKALDSLMWIWDLAENLKIVVEWAEWDEEFYDFLIELLRNAAQNVKEREWQNRINESLVNMLLVKEMEKNDEDIQNDILFDNLI